MSMEEEVRAYADELAKEFHEYWKENGEPHPSSNDYLGLTRAFYLAKGVEKGMKIMTGEEE